VTHSVLHPEGWIGLALLRDGEARIGTTLVAANPLMGEEAQVAIVSPHMHDPENQRVRS